jgi:hypothetical protein
VDPLKQLAALIREKLAKLDRAEKMLYLAVGMSALALWRSSSRARSRYRSPQRALR